VQLVALTFCKNLTGLVSSQIPNELGVGREYSLLLSRKILFPSVYELEGDVVVTSRGGEKLFSAF